MLKKKILMFNKLLKLSFFYRVGKLDAGGADLIGTHSYCLLFNLDNFLYFIFRLIPFFLNLIKKSGCIFFIGVKFILLKWFKKQNSNSCKQELIFSWKKSVFSNFFYTRVWFRSKNKQSLSNLPISFIFLNFDKYLIAFNEINKLHLPLIGLFQKSLNPAVAYSFGGFSHSFFVNCFFFKFFSRFLKYLS
jgi:hypothetical protein